mgnify:CR=1 FL=1
MVGVTWIDTSVAADTVRMVLLATDPSVAVIVAVPAATEVASPLEPAALLTVAIAESDELQVTVAVRSWVEPSEYMPVAVNCRDAAGAILGLLGVTWIEESVAEDTVSVVLPKTDPRVAVIEAEPAATGVASPLEPAALLIVANAVFDELQVTDAVKSWVELSE